MALASLPVREDIHPDPILYPEMPNLIDIEDWISEINGSVRHEAYSSRKENPEF